MAKTPKHPKGEGESLIELAKLAKEVAVSPERSKLAAAIMAEARKRLKVPEPPR